MLALPTLANQQSTQNFEQLVLQCAPNVHPHTMAAIVRTESSFNPFAIGVVGGALSRQPQTMAEAQGAVQALLAKGKNFSMGLGQVNRYNLGKYGLNFQTVFDPCKNLNAGGQILADCYVRALPKSTGQQEALKKAFSCYYSGNFVTGYRHGYVQKVVYNSGQKASKAMAIYVPAVQTDGLNDSYSLPQSQPIQSTSTPDYRQDPKPAASTGAYRVQPIEQAEKPSNPKEFVF